MLTRLILENYIPLLSSGITTVELDTKHMINLFISLNGAGKTSILKEANPLVPENSSYREGIGRKYTEHKINGNHYILDSYTHKSNGHSFKLNGKELNPNGTGAFQKDLVQVHFRLNSTLNRVLNGLRPQDLLCTMTAARRKEIIMQIYPNDTDYALGVYNKLKTERNSLKGAIRNQIQRYTEENRKLQDINDCGVEELENRIKLIETELRQSLLVRGSLEGVTVDPELQDKIKTFTQTVDRLTVNRLSGLISTRSEIAFAIGGVTEFLHLHQEQAGVLKRVIAEHAGTLDGLEEFLADPEVFKVQAGIIKEDLERALTEISQHQTLLDLYPVFNEPDISKANLELVVTGFAGFLGRVTVVSDPTINGAKYKNWLLHNDQLGNDFRQAESNLADLSHKLAHYDRAESVDCPDCSHQFKVGITPAELLALRGKVDAATARVENIKREQGILRTQLDNDADWYLSMNQLFGFIRENNHVPVLSLLIKEFDIGKVDSGRLLNALETYVSWFKLMTKKEELLKERNLLEARVGLLDRNNVADVAIYLAGVEKELVEENNKITHYKERLESLKRTMQEIVSYSRDVNRLRELKEEIFVGLANEGKVEFRRKVDQRIGILGDEKDEHMTSIIKSRSLTAVVTSISGDIDRLKRRLKIVEICMEGLCPNKGLIGRLMSDFIKAICGNMNVIFQEVWNTPLYILPCAKDNGDLTYQFPVIVGEGEPNPDISNCSKGEQEIIDWAWRWVLLGYHPIDYPLFMDEIGVNLDEIKLGRFFNFIQDCTRGKSARQMFLVSHFISTNGIFKDANIVALRYDGLTLPGEVNQHSVIM